MKLYYHPVSTTCRPILLFAAESGIALELELVDLFKGEHLAERYCKVNPNGQVPVLEDGEDFRLTESAAILRYLADTVDSPAYPKDLKKRARVNEMLDWFNTGLYRDLGYGFIYPQVLPHLKREDAKVQAATIAWGRDRSRKWLTILDRNVLGAQPFLCGEMISLADYFGAALLTVGEVAHIGYKAWPNVERWLERMKALPHWKDVNEGFYTYFVAPYANATFEAL
ncbi:MAG TPA: glutathione S-transferase family protein [Burkholderiales bacterium]|jgi:glutathione S-transferase|nr:glutathione S-transferase family protein [Burkholderiales bacterium]